LRVVKDLCLLEVTYLQCPQLITERRSGRLILACGNRRQELLCESPSVAEQSCTAAAEKLQLVLLFVVNQQEVASSRRLMGCSSRSLVANSGRFTPKRLRVCLYCRVHRTR
jgi:hypothetical protein